MISPSDCVPVCRQKVDTIMFIKTSNVVKGEKPWHCITKTIQIDEAPMLCIDIAINTSLRQMSFFVYNRPNSKYMSDHSDMSIVTIHIKHMMYGCHILNTLVLPLCFHTHIYLHRFLTNCLRPLSDIYLFFWNRIA